MLNNEAIQNLQMIKEMAIQIWGTNVELADPKIMNSPYPEFELSMRLYKKIEVGIYYDRSALDIGISQDGKYVLLGKFTSKQVFRGMKAIEPKNLKYNFLLLDEIVSKMIANDI